MPLTVGHGQQFESHDGKCGQEACEVREVGLWTVDLHVLFKMRYMYCFEFFRISCSILNLSQYPKIILIILFELHQVTNERQFCR